MTYDRMTQSHAQSHSVLQWFIDIADTISTETGTTGRGTVEFFYYKLEYFTEISSLWSMDLTINNVTDL